MGAEGGAQVGDKTRLYLGQPRQQQFQQTPGAIRIAGMSDADPVADTGHAASGDKPRELLQAFASSISSADAGPVLTVGIIAGEASGSALGADLIRALRDAGEPVRIVGVGGDDMAQLGAELWLPARELAVMGLVEVLRHLPRLLRLRYRLRRQMLAARPDVFVGIDLPDFNLGVARWLRARGVPTLQYVSPSVWAWRERRVRTIARSVDEVLCLLPFEASFYARHDMPARFVGHPLADQIAQALPQAPAREALGLPPDARVLAVLPGSRQTEVRAVGPVYAAAVAELVAADGGLNVVVPVADASLRAPLQAIFSQHAPGLDRTLAGRQRGAGHGRGGRGAGRVGHGDARGDADRQADGGWLPPCAADLGVVATAVVDPYRTFFAAQPAGR